MKRKIAIILAAAIAAGSLAACASQNTGSSADDRQTQSDGKAEASASEETEQQNNAPGLAAQDADTADTAEEAEALSEGPAPSDEEDEPSAGPGIQIANPWSEAANMQEAADGAGITAFTLPHRYWELGEPALRYMKGAIDADYDRDDVSATIRKIARMDEDADDGWDIDPQDEAQELIGDYNEYTENWTETISGREVYFAGNALEKVNRVYWLSADDAYYYAVLYQSDGGDGMPVYRMRSVIAQIDDRLLDVESQEAPQEVSELLVGEWIDKTSQRAQMEVTRGEYIGEEDYCVKISWAASYAEASVWEMNLTYDPQTGGLTYTNGRKADVTYHEDGSIANENVYWEGAEGSFTISDNKLYWKDSEEDDAADFEFERTYAQAVPADVFAQELFSKAAGLETGSAGASLKAAVMAQDIASFASDHQIWNIKPSEVREAMKEAWDGMSQEERTSFAQNFSGQGGIAELIDAAFNDYASARGLFDDAGVGDAMKELSNNEYARRSWTALRAYVTETAK